MKITNPNQTLLHDASDDAAVCVLLRGRPRLDLKFVEVAIERREGLLQSLSLADSRHQLADTRLRILEVTTVEQLPVIELQL